MSDHANHRLVLAAPVLAAAILGVAFWLNSRPEPEAPVEPPSPAPEPVARSVTPPPTEVVPPPVFEAPAAVVSKEEVPQEGLRIVPEDSPVAPNDPWVRYLGTTKSGNVMLKVLVAPDPDGPAKEVLDSMRAAQVPFWTFRGQTVGDLLHALWKQAYPDGNGPPLVLEGMLPSLRLKQTLAQFHPSSLKAIFDFLVMKAGCSYEVSDGAVVVKRRTGLGGSIFWEGKSILADDGPDRYEVPEGAITSFDGIQDLAHARWYESESVYSFEKMMFRNHEQVFRRMMEPIKPCSFENVPLADALSEISKENGLRFSLPEGVDASISFEGGEQANLMQLFMAIHRQTGLMGMAAPSGKVIFSPDGFFRYSDEERAEFGRRLDAAIGADAFDSTDEEGMDDMLERVVNVLEAYERDRKK